jgi:hypothetical protein
VTGEAQPRRVAQVPSGFAVTASVAATPTGRVDRHVIATMWNGARRLMSLTPADPDPTQLQLDLWADQLTADNDGVRPVVRVVEKAFGPPSPGHVSPYGDAA